MQPHPTLSSARAKHARRKRSVVFIFSANTFFSFLFPARQIGHFDGRVSPMPPEHLGRDLVPEDDVDRGDSRRWRSIPDSVPLLQLCKQYYTDDGFRGIID